MYSFFDSRCMDTVCFVCLLFVTCVMFHLRICFSVLFASISQVIGCEDCLRNDLDCVGSVLNSTYNFEFIALLYMYKARQRRRSRISCVFPFSCLFKTPRYCVKSAEHMVEFFSLPASPIVHVLNEIPISALLARALNSCEY